MTTLLHLSDIHFRKHSGDPADLDRDLRNELELDAQRMRERLGQPSALLVGGDIAYSGQAAEFQIAKEWLDGLCAKLGVTFGRTVWCVPGNHDVDQQVIRLSESLLDAQTTLRHRDTNIDQKLGAYLRDKSFCTQLYRTISEFNVFAETYGFALSPTCPFSQTNIALNDGSILRINGLNSTITSNHQDNEKLKVSIGRLQLPAREDGVTHLVLCHHPPDWWADDDTLEEDLNRRAPIQLFGHKHRQAVRQINNAVRVVAGAVHPDRAETGWRPRYNWLTVEVVGSRESRTLSVTVYPRVWAEGNDRFAADYSSCSGQEFQRYSLPLEPWSPLAIEITPPPATPQAPPIAETGHERVEAMNSPIRTLTFRLFELPLLTRFDIARSLDLVRNDDGGLRDYDVFKRVLQRAADEGHLETLWDRVEAAHNDGRFPINPFSRTEDL